MHKTKNSSFLKIILSLAILGSASVNCYPGTMSSINKDVSVFTNHLIPVPQMMSFDGKIFEAGTEWEIIGLDNLPCRENLIKVLKEGIEERWGISISESDKKNNDRKVIKLSIDPGAVSAGATMQGRENTVSGQAYIISLRPSAISIKANAPEGLFYGIQTLLQLAVAENGMVKLPEGDIHDWPVLKLRIIYWDCAHHLERIETFKRVIRQAASYKINAITLKLEGHFQFHNAVPVVEPNALSPEQYQELTDYAGRHYIQLIPYLDAPAHVSFILKHHEYDSLRALPFSNYEMSVVNPGTYRLISGMFTDLIDANKGVDYALLSTDEAYYVGKTPADSALARSMGGNGRLLAGFISNVAEKLHIKGRDVIFWGEFPLTAGDIKYLPPYMINGEYNKAWAQSYREKGIRQLIYTSTQGEEPLFPNYYHFSPADKDKVGGMSYANNDAPSGRVQGVLNNIESALSDNNTGILGVIVAAWSDAGLNPETFWLGYVTGTAYAWNNNCQGAPELTRRFFNSFYGTEALEMEKIYRLMSTQAEFYNMSWDRSPSDLRSPIIGNSEGIYNVPQPAHDKTLSPLPIPTTADLSLKYDRSRRNEWRKGAALYFLKENNELEYLIKENLHNDVNQQYNLEIFLSIAAVCRHNIDFILGLDTINSLMQEASSIAGTKPAYALRLLDKAINKAVSLTHNRDSIFREITELWYRDWYPLEEKANNRKFLFKVDDVKDHLPGRTIDLGYLFYPEINYHLEDWAREITNIRKRFSEAHRL
ncbi:MAG TPA: glycoside hydrolase family 20 zincin-like fold domain-containing protein, partial [Bacteroidales bacterium]|nr:glycoside hydrolase family 20 zincin-like fold domain-containing protein [Bacteroidales bacterium]